MAAIDPNINTHLANYHQRLQSMERLLRSSYETLNFIELSWHTTPERATKAMQLKSLQNVVVVLQHSLETIRYVGSLYQNPSLFWHGNHQNQVQAPVVSTPPQDFGFLDKILNGDGTNGAQFGPIGTTAKTPNNDYIEGELQKILSDKEEKPI